MLAREIGQENPLPSLEMCIEDVGALGVCGAGYSCAYANTISWSSPTSPLPMERNPQVIFERLFGAGGTPEERIERRQTQASILDSVVAEVASLQRGLGASDARASTIISRICARSSAASRSRRSAPAP